jgi:hypothetical protein
VQHVLDAHHVQEGLLLAGERRVGQVFGGGRRAHGEAGLRLPACSVLEGGADLALQVGGKRLRFEPAADLGAGGGQRAHVFGVQRLQALLDAIGQAGVGEELRGRRGPWWRSRWGPHALGSCEIISPRLAFLPPTASTSVILRFSNGTTRAVALNSADMGKLRKLKAGLRSGGAGGPGRAASLLFEWAGARRDGHIMAAIVGSRGAQGPRDCYDRAMAMHSRTVFFISDGTGITAETFGNAILAQFEFKPRHVRLPFIDTVDKAHQVVRQVNHVAELEGRGRSCSPRW